MRYVLTTRMVKMPEKDLDMFTTIRTQLGKTHENVMTISVL